MKSLAIAALIAAELVVAAQPAMAAELGDAQSVSSQRQGAFAGARVRIPLGGSGERKARAGFAVAPIVAGRQADGSVRTRFGEGVEYGFAGGSKTELSFGGRPLAQLARGRNGPEGRKMGVSTLGWVGIGLGVVAVIFVTAIVWCDADNDCPPGE